MKEEATEPNGNYNCAILRFPIGAILFYGSGVLTGFAVAGIILGTPYKFSLFYAIVFFIIGGKALIRPRDM